MYALFQHTLSTNYRNPPYPYPINTPSSSLTQDNYTPGGQENAVN